MAGLVFGWLIPLEVYGGSEWFLPTSDKGR